MLTQPVLRLGTARDRDCIVTVTVMKRVILQIHEMQ
jgi:hypothetical protein